MDEFNPYISTIDTDYWRDICVREGELRHYKAGEFFLEAGRIGRFIGFIKAGTLKYIVVEAFVLWFGFSAVLFTPSHTGQI